MKTQNFLCLETQTVARVCLGILLKRRAGNSKEVFSLTSSICYCVSLNSFLPRFSYLFIIALMSSMATTMVSLGSFLGVIGLWDIYLIVTSRVS